MNLYEQFHTDKKLEKEGILLQYGENSKGQPVCLRIARAGGANERFSKRLDVASKPYRRQIQTETIDTGTVTRMMRQVYAETVVLDWENVELAVKDADGNPTGEFTPAEYSVANCLQLFDDLPDLWLDVQDQAGRAALYRATVREADAGN